LSHSRGAAAEGISHKLQNMNKLPVVLGGGEVAALSGRKITVVLDQVPVTFAHTKMANLPDNIK
jgi:hypothetical protein